MKISYLLILPFILLTNFVSAQLNANGAYLMGTSAEIAINNMGYEGTSDLAGSHARSDQFNPLYYFGFVANPQNNAWATYNGDFFTPGSSENGFGFELNGVNYSNNADPNSFSNADIPGTLSNYTVNGNCLSVQWDGATAGIGVKQVYRFNSIKLHYVVEVTITNNTGAAVNDFYFYRNLDPDNNVFLNSMYDTENEIEAQASASCPISLVSASQTTPFASYLGLAAVGQNFRVTYGGFSNRDASDIWNFVGFTGTVGSINQADEAISLAYKIPTLAAGASHTFSFAIVLDQTEVGEAFSGLYQLANTNVDDCNPVVDTIPVPCGGPAVPLTVTGPDVNAYTWTWSPATGLNTTSGPSVLALPSTTTLYTVVGTPTTCLNNTITKQVYVTFSGPVVQDTVINSTDCNSFDLTTYTPVDLSNTPGSVITYHTVEPTSANDMSNQYTGTTVSPGQTIFVMIADPTGTCFAVDEINVNFSPDVAGPDSTNTICASSLAPINFNTWLQGATPGGIWTETSTTPSGSFNTSTGVLTTSSTAPGTYTFVYKTNTPAPCPVDSAVMTLSIVSSVTAGLDSTIVLCQSSGEIIDLNDLLNGNNTTGSWTIPPAVAANVTPAGTLTNNTIPSGSYNFTYTVAGTGSCPSDNAIMTVNVTSTPIIDPIADLTTCPGYALPVITGTNLSANVSYYDAPNGGGNEFVVGTPIMNTITLYAYDAFGPANACNDEEDFTITIIDTVDLEFVADKLIGCPPLDVTFTNTSAQAVFNCVWNFNDGTGTYQNCGPIQHTFQNAGVYTVSFSAENSIGCFGNETKVAYITVIENPVANFTSTPNVVDILDTEVQFVNSSTNAVSYSWTFGDGNSSTLQNPINVYPEIGEQGYEVQLIAQNSIGCADTANAVVFINDIVIFYIPNSFTPDGDEFNNSFKPVLNSGIDLFSYHLVLYNRWGEIIFETKDPLIGWDGTYHDKLVQEGTYTWTIEFKETMSDKRHNYNGKVTMIR